MKLKTYTVRTRNSPLERCVGMRFGRLTVIALGGWHVLLNGKRIHRLKCRCDCGAIKEVTRGSLASSTRSCGCLAKEFRAAGHITHGESKGEKQSPEYRSWLMMRGRCRNKRNPNYKHYGGRGISICSDWDSYQLFLRDMGRRPSANHSIDRINNDGNYEPGNCRWATPLQQSNNSRHVRWITYNGETKSLTGWAASLNYSIRTIARHLKTCGSVKDALTLPITFKIKLPV